MVVRCNDRETNLEANILSDLWPVSIRSHGEEKVRLFIFMTDSQRVLKKLLHIRRPTLVSEGKYHTSNLSIMRVQQNTMSKIRKDNSKYLLMIFAFIEIF